MEVSIISLVMFQKRQKGTNKYPNIIKNLQNYCKYGQEIPKQGPKIQRKIKTKN